jgi:hypothetical protein
MLISVLIEIEKFINSSFISESSEVPNKAVILYHVTQSEKCKDWMDAWVEGEKGSGSTPAWKSF